MSSTAPGMQGKRTRINPKTVERGDGPIPGTSDYLQRHELDAGGSLERGTGEDPFPNQEQDRGREECRGVACGRAGARGL